MVRTANGLRAAFEADEPAVGVLDDAYSPRLVELYGERGLDFVWVDLEHGGPSPRDGDRVEALLRAAEAGGTDLVVRAPDGDPATVRKLLDLGVRSVFLPRIESVDALRAAVRAAQFEGTDGGDRGLAAPRASRWGGVGDYRAVEDRETLVGVTVETAAAVERIDEVLAVPELGFVFVGPYDLSVSLGHPGETDHPEVRAAVETVRERAVEAGVPLGGLAAGPGDLREMADRGYRMLHAGSTTGALGAATTDWLDALDR